MSSNLVDFAVTTIFARECLEGSIIVGQYRSIVLRGGGHALAPGVSQKDALSEILVATLCATALALFVIACVAVPLAVLSHELDPTTAYIIEGVSKIVAGVSLLQLSLKIPKMLEIYGSCKKRNSDGSADRSESGLTLRNIRFNVAWNIWRETAEVGIFLIPFFLSGDDLIAIPLSAVIGSAVGLLCGAGIYIANRRLKKKLHLCIFAVLLLVVLSAGLFTGGCYKVGNEIWNLKKVWTIEGDFWSVDRLPMTIFKPFGYNDSRTVLEIVCFWSWLALSALLHYRKYRRAPRVSSEPSTDAAEVGDDIAITRESSDAEDVQTVELGEASSINTQSLASLEKFKTPRNY